MVTNLARPGGNLTGVSFLVVELATKRLEFLRELVPGAARVESLLLRCTVLTCYTEFVIPDVGASR